MVLPAGNQRAISFLPYSLVCTLVDASLLPSFLIRAAWAAPCFIIAGATLAPRLSFFVVAPAAFDSALGVLVVGSEPDMNLIVGVRGSLPWSCTHACYRKQARLGLEWGRG